MNRILQFLLLGVSLAAPIGPVNAAILEKGLRNGFWQAMFVSFGAALADLLYMLLVYFGFARYLTQPLVQSFLYFSGCFVLVYMGIECLVKVRGMNQRQVTTVAPLHSLRYGFFLSLVNPLSIMFWIAIYGSVLVQVYQTGGSDKLIFYTAMIFAGMFAWDMSLALLATSFRRFLSNKLLQIICVASGLSLLGFGIYFGWHALLTL